jgi:formylglycine-generating enzyme required for sulfatase activity
MSPQQFRGEPAQFSDDIYALGATLFHLLTGEVPTPDGEQFALRLESVRADSLFQRLARHQAGSDIPPEVNEAVARCLDKDPNRRPGSIRKAGIELNVPPVEWRRHGVETKRKRNIDLGPILIGAGAIAALVGYSRQVRDGESFWGPARRLIAQLEKPNRSPSDPVPPEPAPIPAPIANGPMTARLTFTVNSGLVPLEWRLVDEAGRDWSNGVVSSQGIALASVPPGLYRMEVGAGEKSSRHWMAVPITLAAHDERQLALDYRVGQNKLILNHTQGTEITVADAWTNFAIPVDWSQVPANGAVELYSTRGPLLYAGEVTYRVTAPYHFPAEKRVTLQPGNREVPVTILLTPCPYPMPSLKFKNETLDAVFHPVGDFWAAETETTVEQYQKFVDAHPTLPGPGRMLSTGRSGLKPADVSWMNAFPGQSRHHPVVGVSWDEANAFSKWLTEVERAAGRLNTNQSYSLPTDQQWHQLSFARTAEFPWGSRWPPGSSSGNYAGEEVLSSPWPPEWSHLSKPGYSDSWPRTAPVRSYPPNGFGLHDVGGNAAEWCLDLYRPELNSPEVLADNPDLAKPADANAYRVVRGGSWADDDRMDLRTATRQRVRQETRSDQIGFRLVLVETRTPEAP